MVDLNSSAHPATATLNGHATNGHREDDIQTQAQAAFHGLSPGARIADLDPSQLTIQLAEKLEPLPPPESLVFGQTKTDHMLVVSFDPETGWGPPAIKPYGPLSLDPASSCFQYCPNVFEGMKAYMGPDGKPRLFRPDLNMKRMERSVKRVALPALNSEALLLLIKKLVVLESRWIPKIKGYSLYIRPTVIGTRPSLGVAASNHALLYIIVSPTGPFFPTGHKPVSLLAISDNVRSWPGGTGAYKLGLNYAPCFQPQQDAEDLGYQQILWLIGDDRRITEVGQMNFMIVVQRDDGDLDLMTPPLDGVILPGVTRRSVLELAANHSKQPLPGLDPSLKLHVNERILTIQDLMTFRRQETLLEAFGTGTAAIIAPVCRIGFEGEDILLPLHEKGLGPVAHALWQRIVDIQEGTFSHEWSISCEA